MSFIANNDAGFAAPSVFKFDKDRLQHELQRICPRELDWLPSSESFEFSTARTIDGLRTALKIGQVEVCHRGKWHDAGVLWVVDEGADKDLLPDLTCYNSEGQRIPRDSCVHRFTYERNLAKAIVLDLGHRRSYTSVSDNTLAVALIQYIFVICGRRNLYVAASNIISAVDKLTTLMRALERVSGKDQPLP